MPWRRWPSWHCGNRVLLSPIPGTTWATVAHGPGRNGRNVARIFVSASGCVLTDAPCIPTTCLCRHSARGCATISAVSEVPTRDRIGMRCTSKSLSHGSSASLARVRCYSNSVQNSAAPRTQRCAINDQCIAAKSTNRKTASAAVLPKFTPLDLAFYA